MNSKKIFENGNKTIALKNNISEIIVEKSMELSLHCDNENKELKNTIKMLEEAIEKVKEDMTSFKENVMRNEESAKELKKANQKIESSLKYVHAFSSKDWKVQNRKI